jgi:hypothetical protein
VGLQRGLTREPRDEIVESWGRWLDRIGGELLDTEICRPRELTYRIGKGIHNAFTCACGNASRGRLPFKGDAGSPAIVCGVCDAATQFPRYADR